ncbi:MAG: hypothetical protein LQ339_001101 [Xanthoria mediterranea]|nr:MAG: hypothetical protein LQ339_001101 [Xanthoria mediterranea]
MDLIEGIGQRYLMGKANPAPQQLENLMKKQWKGETTVAPAKAPTAAPEVGNNKEIEALRKQIAEMRAMQDKPAAGPSQRRKSIESVVSRGRSRTPRERNEISPAKRLQSAGTPSHHHAEPEKSRRKAPAAGLARETPPGKPPSSVNPSATASGRPVTQKGRGEKHNHSTSTPAGRGRDADSKAQAPVVTTPVHQFNTTGSTRLDSASERPRPATDFCVVELMEEEPRGQRRVRQGRPNIVEVVEKKGNRTRYVVN